MKAIVEGELYAIFKKDDLRNRGSAEIINSSHVLQLIIKKKLSNGSIEHELHNISIPENSVNKYKGKEGQTIQVPCNILIKGDFDLCGI